MKQWQFLTLTLSALPILTIVSPKSGRTGLLLDDGFLAHLINFEHPESPARYQEIASIIAI